MITPARLAIFVLVSVLIGLGGYSYWEHQQRLAAEVALQVSDRDRADLRKRLWSAQNRPAPAVVATPVVETVEGGPLMPGVVDDPRNQRPADLLNRFTRLFDNPAAQRLIAVQQKAALDSRYSALFRSLRLPPEQLEKFKALLVEKQNAVIDVMAAARSQGLNGRDNRAEIVQLIQGAQAEVDASIRSTLGDSAYAQYQGYEQTIPQRNTVGLLESRLSYSDQPLTAQQTDQLVSILAANGTGASAARPGGGVTARFGGAFNTNTAPITDTAVAQAQGVLTPSQVQTLQQLQQEQQAQAQLAKLMRNQLQQRRSGGATPDAGTAAPAKPAPPPGR